jgi:exoribonuclease II
MHRCAWLLGHQKGNQEKQNLRDSVTQMVFITMNSERKVDMEDVDLIGERETGTPKFHKLIFKVTHADATINYIYIWKSRQLP